MTTPGRDKDVSDAEMLVAILHAPDPVATAAEVGDAVGISRQGADKRLRQLAEQGLVNSVKKGSRLWWLSDEGLAHIGDKAAQSDSDGAS
jgi:hypothetical protein